MGLKFVGTLFWLFWSFRLKSDQNGIEIFFILSEIQIFSELKSDQNGIEIKTAENMNPFIKKLKSDQNGIEIRSHIRSSWTLFTVKIRPKWD